MDLNAIVRPPASSYIYSISEHPLRGKINSVEAMRQHDIFCQRLSDLGCRIHSLPADERFPDGCFVEDRCFVFQNTAVICPSNVENRKGEEIEIKRVISNYKVVEEIVFPGTVDGGDIIAIEGYLFGRISKRTNLEGIKQLSALLEEEVKLLTIPEEILHLKSITTYLGRKIILVRQDLSSIWDSAKYDLITVPKREAAGANCIAIGNQVLVVAGVKETIKEIRRRGFKTVEIEISEFEKGDGLPTCLAIFLTT
jgi:dimethylargininase